MGSLLKKACNQTAYLKAGVMGFAGSGKTFTASALALGLASEIGDKKPVAFFDTETGSDFMIPRFEQAGVELLVAKTRAFKDLLQFMKEAEATCSVAIIDSISHVWKELLDSYLKKAGKRRLEFQHWGPIKNEWQSFTDVYLNSQMHVVLCGRAGWEYSHESDEDGKKELVKVGTKMKAESDMGYEPSLLIEMVRLRRSEEQNDPKAKGWINRAVILKDRTDRMNGKEIDFPSYESFRPVISFLNLGGKHVGIDTSRTSEDMFDTPEYSRNERARQVAITLELVKEALILADLEGNSADAKKRRVPVLQAAFGTSSWTAIESMRLEAMQDGLRKMRLALGQDTVHPPSPEAQASVEGDGGWVSGEAGE